jgi:GDP-L-fucose synthase
MVGSAILRRSKQAGYDVLTARKFELNLSDAQATQRFLTREKPDAVILAAARVGGIEANRLHRADFLVENLEIQNSVIKGALKSNVPRLIFLGSSCVYPKNFSGKISETDLLSGPLEETNEGYALAKIAGIKYCEYLSQEEGVIYNSLMPPNLYGPHDNFDLNSSHVPAALMRRFHEAKENSANEVVIWGSGKPLREFMHVDDLASAVLFALENYREPGLLNIGPAPELSIADFALAMKEVVGYGGTITFDASKPDGVSRKRLNCARISALGWKPSIGIVEGFASTYEWLIEELKKEAVRGWN